MVNRNLLRQYDLPEEELNHELAAAFTSEESGTDIENWLAQEAQVFEVNKIVTGRVVNVLGDAVVVDVGYKSEGIIPLQEWRDEADESVQPPRIGDEIQVLLDAVEDEGGAVVLSYRKAKRQKEWEDVLAKYKEGDIVSGLVTRKIKGGLLVNIGVNVFLPSSQVDLRRPHDLGEYVNSTIECKILRIDEVRRNIVVSRRQLLADIHVLARERLLPELQPGQIRKGIVKNIVEFGAFVDLGGIDGLLHVTDMSWGRVANPHDVVKIDQELEVYVINVDREREKIALGLKQLTPSPWASVPEKYPVGSRHTGEVVNVMSYGAFVKLEPGIEGLVHVSEMSWTRRINHPSEVVASGDMVEVQVLKINKEKQEISLGMKQVQPNPWDVVVERYPPGAVVHGTVRNLTNYGAFIEIEDGIDGLLHVTDMSWVRKITHPSEMVAKGDPITCVVLNVDQERKRIALGLKQMSNDPWQTDIPARYKPGDIHTGKVTKLANFGVFVELEPGLEGLLHISELADAKKESPENPVQIGDELEVKVLRVDTVDRKIGLSRKRLHDSKEESAAASSQTPAPPKRGLRGGTGAGTGQLVNMTEGDS